MNLIGKWINLSRVYEIALLGKYDIALYANKNEYPDVESDVKLIKQFYNRVNFSQYNALNVQLDLPVNLTSDANFETLSNISDRVFKASLNFNSVYEVKFEVTSAIEALINTYKNRYPLSLSRYNFLVDVSKTIARLDNSPTVRVQHLAEAMHYITPIEHSYIGEDRLVEYIKKEIKSKTNLRDKSETLNDKIQLGGQIKALKNTLYFIKTHEKF